MVVTDTFAKFARRMSSTQGFPYVVIAETPNPIRQLDSAALRPRAEAMIQTVIDGLTLPPAELQAYGDLINDFFRDEFLPALQSAVTMALLIIKYDFETEWFQSVIDLLVRAFDEAHQLQRLKFGYFSQRPGTLRYWRRLFECQSLHLDVRVSNSLIVDLVLSRPNCETARTPIAFPCAQR